MKTHSIPRQARDGEQSRTILALAIMVLCTGTAINARYGGGMGEPNDPYRIATAEDLNDIGNYEEDWDKHFVLVNDVNLAQYTGRQFQTIGTAWNNAFTGVFDGNDHKIWNFTWDSNGIGDVGLFGSAGGRAQIKNLGVENVDVNAVNGYHVGGLVGWNIEHGTITNCYSTGSVSGSGGVGGLVGDNRGTISACYSTASVSGDYSSVGGLVGENYYGTIINSYSTGSVTGNGLVGGLVGSNGENIGIINCYSRGSVSGSYIVGGLVGYSESTVADSFWDIETSGQSGSAGGIPKTTAEMKTMNIFTDAGWDFVEIWGIGENQTYPFLLTDPAGDSNHDKKVDLIDLAILASHWLEGPP